MKYFVLCPQEEGYFIEDFKTEEEAREFIEEEKEELMECYGDLEEASDFIDGFIIIKGEEI